MKLYHSIVYNSRKKIATFRHFSDFEILINDINRNAVDNILIVKY
jgi:hypothetical protein